MPDTLQPHALEPEEPQDDDPTDAGDAGVGEDPGPARHPGRDATDGRSSPAPDG